MINPNTSTVNISINILLEMIRDEVDNYTKELVRVVETSGATSLLLDEHHRLESDKHELKIRAYCSLLDHLGYQPDEVKDADIYQLIVAAQTSAKLKRTVAELQARDQDDPIIAAVNNLFGSELLADKARYLGKSLTDGHDDTPGAYLDAIKRANKKSASKACCAFCKPLQHTTFALTAYKFTPEEMNLNGSDE